MIRADAFFAALHSPALMGIVNVTPNSFSDTGAHLTPDAAIAHSQQLARAGAAILDLGAEASSFFRPGVAPVPPEAQLARLLPVVQALSAFRIQHSAFPLLSIDTRAAQVARACLNAGADIINDISAGTHDPAMLPTVAELGAPIILMHITPTYPATPTADDPDIVATVTAALAARRDAALAAGILPHRILLDPGLGFGKTMADNWRLLLNAPAALAALGAPVVIGASRKRFLMVANAPVTAEIQDLRTILAPLATLATHDRDLPSALATALAARRGVLIHRVHNVALCAQALRLPHYPSPPLI